MTAPSFATAVSPIPSARVVVYAGDSPRAQERIDALREECRFLVDEIFHRESLLRFPPERVCPGCSRAMAKSRG